MKDRSLSRNSIILLLFLIGMSSSLQGWPMMEERESMHDSWKSLDLSREEVRARAREATERKIGGEDDEDEKAEEEQSSTLDFSSEALVEFLMKAETAKTTWEENRNLLLTSASRDASQEQEQAALSALVYWRNQALLYFQAADKYDFSAEQKEKLEKVVATCFEVVNAITDYLEVSIKVSNSVEDDLIPSKKPKGKWIFDEVEQRRSLLLKHLSRGLEEIAQRRKDIEHVKDLEDKKRTFNKLTGTTSAHSHRLKSEIQELHGALKEVAKIKTHLLGLNFLTSQISGKQGINFEETEERKLWQQLVDEYCNNDLYKKVDVDMTSIKTLLKKPKGKWTFDEVEQRRNELLELQRKKAKSQEIENARGRFNTPIGGLLLQQANLYERFQKEVQFDFEKEEEKAKEKNDFEKIPQLPLDLIVDEEVKSLGSSVDHLLEKEQGVHSTSQKKSLVSLKNFLLAVKNNPTATRLIVEPDQSDNSLKLVVSKSLDPRKLFFQSQTDKDKNQEVATLLHDALCEKYQVKGPKALDLINRQFLGNNTANWSADKIRRLIKEVDEKLEPAIPNVKISSEDLEQFPGARVIDQFEEVDPSGDFHKKITILKTELLLTPYVRIEESFNTTSDTPFRKIKMGADHLLVSFDKAEEAEEVRSKLEKTLNLPIALQKTALYSPLYRVCFNEFRQFSKILEEAKKLGVVCSFNTLSYQCHAPRDKYYPQQWNLHDKHGINASKIWETIEGIHSLQVAIIDTGIHHKHDDFGIKDRILAHQQGHNFITGEETTKDINGHGTHCAGIIGAVHNKIGIAGVLKNVQLIPFKVSDEPKAQDITDQALIDSIFSAYARGIEFLNCSIGEALDKKTGQYSRVKNEVLLRALKQISNPNEPLKPSVLIFSAGNDGQDNDIAQPYPASYAQTAINPDGAENILVVAATDEEGQLVRSPDWNSNFGKQTVHLAAPGKDIWSTYIRKEKKWWNPFETKDNAYEKLSGTSMAAPHVTATLALMRQVFPLATAEELVDRLLATTDPIPTLDRNHDIVLNIHTIAGRLNLAHALRKDLLGPFGEYSQKIFYPIKPGEHQSFIHSQEAINLRSTAEEAAIIAEFTRKQDEAGQIPLNGKTRADDAENRAIDSWEKLVKKCEQALLQSPEAFKSWWKQELQYARGELDHWNEKFMDRVIQY